MPSPRTFHTFGGDRVRLNAIRRATSDQSNIGGLVWSVFTGALRGDATSAIRSADVGTRKRALMSFFEEHQSELRRAWTRAAPLDETDSLKITHLGVEESKLGRVKVELRVEQWRPGGRNYEQARFLRFAISGSALGELFVGLLAQSA